MVMARPRRKSPTTGKPATPKWKLYEWLAEKIMRDFTSAGTVSVYGHAPIDAAVKWNDSIYGHESETQRQIDVSVRWSAYDREFLTIIDAKDHTEAADVNVIGAFSAVVRDVRATTGILVCNAGFTQAAHVYARNLGIHLLGLHDAQSSDWRFQVRVPLLWIDKSVEAKVTAPVWLDAGDSIEQGWLYVPRVMLDGQPQVINLHKAITRRWNSGELPRTTGVTHMLDLGSGCELQVETRGGERIWRAVPALMVAYEVRQQAWLGHLSPQDARGVVDYLAGGAFIVSHLGDSLPVKRDERWQPIGDPAQVATTLMGTVLTSESLEISGEITHGDFEVSYLGEGAGFPPAYSANFAAERATGDDA
jgi:hypothetical protein